MKTIVGPLLATLMDLLRSRVLAQVEMLALRQQLAMAASRDRKRLCFRRTDSDFVAEQ